MDTTAIAKDFVALCAKGEFDAAGEKYWASDCVSIEAMPGDMQTMTGKAALKEKGAWWYANNTVHGVKVEGPYVNGDQFVVRFTMDVTPKGGARMTMDEVGIYTLKNGKIIEERFAYAM